MFVGSYLEKIMNSKVVIPFDLNSQLHEVLCVKDTAGHIYLIVCAHDDEDINEIEKYTIVLNKQRMSITNTIELPREFLEYIDDDEVCVYGCFDKVEIHRGKPYEIEKLNEEETLQLIKILEDLEL